MIYRLYIGSNNKTHKVELNKINKEVGSYFDAYTLFKSRGYWKGRAENSVIAEIQTTEESKVNELVKRLVAVLEQEAIGLVKVDSEMQFIS